VLFLWKCDLKVICSILQVLKGAGHHIYADAKDELHRIVNLIGSEVDLMRSNK
jgi:hypothetical protein